MPTNLWLKGVFIQDRAVLFADCPGSELNPGEETDADPAPWVYRIIPTLGAHK